MSSNPNDPRPTSIQAGIPRQGGGPTEPGDIRLTPSSPLDRLLTALKAHERWGLVLGVAVQLLVLAAMIVMGAGKSLGVVIR